MSAKNTNSHLRVRMLCEGAMMVALAQVLSYIKLMELPNGGSLTPAMFPIILFAVRWGLTPGLMAGFTFGLLQLIFDGAYAWGWQSMLLDYLVAFTPLGLAGLFKGKKWGIFVGTVVGCLGRFVVHYISGVTIYKILAPTEFMKWTFTSPSAYSLVYNGSYMLPNTIIALVIAAVLYKPLKKYILGQDLEAAERVAAENRPGVHVHLYGKTESRPKRKMGHITVLTDDTRQTVADLERTGCWDDLK